VQEAPDPSEHEGGACADEGAEDGQQGNRDRDDEDSETK